MGLFSILRENKTFKAPSLTKILLVKFGEEI